MENKTYLGIDWGKSKIGLAIGDSETSVAVPYKVVSDLDAVLEVIKAEMIDAIVLGEPRRLSGDKDYLDEYKTFVAELADKSGLSLERVDERLTSRLADTLRNQSGETSARAKRSNADQDAVAAMLILQAFFDRQ